MQGLKLLVCQMLPAGFSWLDGCVAFFLPSQNTQYRLLVFFFFCLKWMFAILRSTVHVKELDIWHCDTDWTHF